MGNFVKQEANVATLGSRDWVNMLPRPMHWPLQDSAAVMLLLDIAPGVSRIHASRRVFELLGRHSIDLPVIHRRSFPAGAS